MEYSQDRLNHRIEELEAEVTYQKRVIESYKEIDKDRGRGEAAIFTVGLIIGTAIGFYLA
jgi:hypothetical protein